MYYGVLKKGEKNTQIHECRTVTNKEIHGILFYPESATGLRLCSRECYNNTLLLLVCFSPRMIAEDYRSWTVASPFYIISELMSSCIFDPTILHVSHHKAVCSLNVLTVCSILYYLFSACQSYNHC